MKRICSILILIVCVITLATSFAGCSTSKIYKASDLEYNFNESYYYIDIDYSFTLAGLPNGKLDLRYTVRLEDGGNLVYFDEITKTVTVEKDETTTRISGNWSISKAALSYGWNSPQLTMKIVEDVELVDMMSNEENRLKPYSIAICVLSSVGAGAMIILFAVGYYLKKKKYTSDKPQTDNQELNN